MARKKDSDPTLVSIPVDGATELLYVSDEDTVWNATGDLEFPVGAVFAKLRPPARVTDAELERVVSALRRSGVEVIVILPRDKVATPVTKVMNGAPARATIRAIVDEAVSRSGVSDKAQLAAFLDKVLLEVGL